MEKTRSFSTHFSNRVAANKQIKEKQKKNRHLHPSLLTVGCFRTNLFEVRDNSIHQMELDKEDKKRLENLKRRAKGELSDSRKIMADMKAERLKKNGGISSIVEGILLEHANVNKAAYHGGNFEGGSCIRLLDNNTKVMEEIKSVCDARLASPRSIRNPCSQERLDAKFEEFSNLFSALDAAFSLLRLVKPSEDEIEEAKKAVSVLEQLWRQAKLSITLKAHIIFNHAIQQMIDFEGLGDKCEDFIERGHQTGAKLSHLTARMGKNFKSKFSSQRRREWMQSDPRVQLQTKAVKEKCKQNF